MIRRLTALLIRTLAALVIALLFAAYGYHDHNPDPFGGPSVYVPPSWTGAFERAWTTLRATMQGQHLQAMYWGVGWSDIFLSLRLIGLAGLIALAFGTGFAIIQARSRSAVVRQAVEIVCGWLDSVDVRRAARTNTIQLAMDRSGHGCSGACARHIPTPVDFGVSYAHSIG